MEKLEKVAQETSIKVSVPSDYASEKEAEYEGLVLKQAEVYSMAGTGKLYWM